jgi:hypothetical protein
MKFSAILALSAATSALASPTVPEHLQQAPLLNEEKFLIELGPGETRWITEDEKWELKRVRIAPSSRDSTEHIMTLSVLTMAVRMASTSWISVQRRTWA